MKHENKEINCLIEALEKAKYHKGEFTELEPVLKSVTTIVANFNEINEIDPVIEEIKEWAEEGNELRKSAAESLKIMQESNSNASAFL
jgi:hypothetical protein